MSIPAYSDIAKSANDVSLYYSPLLHWLLSSFNPIRGSCEGANSFCHSRSIRQLY